MRKAYSYSIWLVPERPVYDKLQAITDMLSKKYGSPAIRPHVTLLGGFTGDIEEAVRKAEQLARMVDPFDVRLTSVAYRNEFFRSLYILAEPTVEIMDAYETARRHFNMPETPDMFFHLSLIYGDFSEPVKEEIIREIGKHFNISFRANKIHFVVNNERDKVWQEIAAFPLK